MMKVSNIAFSPAIDIYGQNEGVVEPLSKVVGEAVGHELTLLYSGQEKVNEDMNLSGDLSGETLIQKTLDKVKLQIKTFFAGNIVFKSVDVVRTLLTAS